MTPEEDAAPEEQPVEGDLLEVPEGRPHHLLQGALGGRGRIREMGNPWSSEPCW